MPVQSIVRDYASLDLDGDGDNDLFCSTWDFTLGTRGVYENLGRASFQPYSVIDSGPPAVRVVVADFDGDQIDDLIRGGLTAGGWKIMLGSPQGLTAPTFAAPFIGDIDVDGDGTLDLV